MTTTEPSPQMPQTDWWQRENQKRQMRLLLLLLFILALIGFYYYISLSGKTGLVDGINFDTSNHIAFLKQKADGNTALYAVRGDGTGLRELTQSSDTSEKNSPCWTRHGHHILYASNRRNASRTQIYILGAGAPVQLTYGSFRKDNPIVSPDSKHVAFITQGNIKTVYLNGNDVEQILPAPIAGNQPGAGSEMTMNPVGPYFKEAFSPAGSSIAGVQQLSTQGNADMPGLAGNTEMARVLTPKVQQAMVLDFGRYADISWSERSSQLMVSYAERYITDPVSKKDILVGGISIWDLTKPQSSAENHILVTEGYTIMPRRVAWSPNGKEIAFDAYRLQKDGSRIPLGIYIISVPTQTLVIKQGQPLPPAAIPAGSAGIPSRPQWSPNGSRLLYEVRLPSGKHDIWVVNSDLTNPINLTHGAADNSDNIEAVWSPAQSK